MAWLGNNRKPVRFYLLIPCDCSSKADRPSRKPDHLRPIHRDRTHHLANPLLCCSPSLLPQTSSNPNRSLATLHRPLFHGELPEQLRFWLQYFSPGPYHTPERR